MSSPQYHYLQSSTVDGVLVATITESRLHGDVEVERVRRELLALVADAGASKIVLDFQKVQYISSAGFRPLLSLKRKLQETNGRMVLCNLSPPVTEVFQQLRMISTNPLYHAMFDAQPDVGAAVAFLNGTPPPK